MNETVRDQVYQAWADEAYGYLSDQLVQMTKDDEYVNRKVHEKLANLFDYGDIIDPCLAADKIEQQMDD